MENEDLTPIKSDEKDTQWNIKKIFTFDTYMLPCKVAYFFTLSKESSFLPYILLFLIGTGLSPDEAGMISGFRVLGMICGGPIWGFIADRRQNHRTLVLIIVIASLIFFAGQPFFSLFFANSEINTCPKKTRLSNLTFTPPLNTIPDANATKSSLMIENKISNFTISVAASTTEINNSTSSTTRLNSNSNHSYANPKNNNIKNSKYKSNLFLTLLFLNIIASFFDGNCMSMIDTGVVQRMNRASTPKNFGWNRVFGAVGFFAGSFLSGVVIDNFPTLSVNCYSGMFCVYAVFYLGIAVSSQFLFLGPSTENNMEGHKKVSRDSTLIRNMVFRTLRNLEVAIFFMTVFNMGLYFCLFISFGGLRLKEIGGSTSVLGLTISIGAASAIPLMFLSNFLIRILGGIWNCLVICCIFHGIRLFGFAYIENPWLFIPLNLTNSVSFGLMIATMVLYVKEISHPQIYTTMISIMNVIFYGVAPIVGNPVGGQIYNRYKGKILFTVFGILCSAWTIFLCVFIMIRKIVGTKTVKSTAENEVPLTSV